MKDKESIECSCFCESDRIKDFDCGVESINKWYIKNASENNEISKSYHLSYGGIPVGFTTLYVTTLRKSKLKQSHEDAGSYPSEVSVICIGQFAIDKRFQGRNLSYQLMFNALKIAVLGQKSVGGRGIILHPVNDSLVEFYQNFGFELIRQESHETIMYMSIEKAREIVRR